MHDSQLTLAQQLAVCQQVARLVRAKLPISGELARLANDASRTTADSARAVDPRLASGQSLAQALASDDSRRSRVLSACIAVGEQSGKVDQALESWTAMHLAASRCKQSLRTAMIYPSLLIIITLLSLSYIVWLLIPEYRTTYALFSAELPGWLELLVLVRERLGLLTVGLLILGLLPVAIWYLRRTGFDRYGLPRETANRLRCQALSTELATIGISSGMPLNQLLPLSVLACSGNQLAADESFAWLQQQQPVPPLCARHPCCLRHCMQASFLPRRRNAICCASHSTSTNAPTHWLPEPLAGYPCWSP